MTLEQERQDLNTPWYKGNGPYFEQNLKRGMELEKLQVEEGRSKWWERLMTERPSTLVRELRDTGKSPEVVSNFLKGLLVFASAGKNEEGKEFVRVVDGYHKNEKGWLSPVYTEVYWE